jgi:hypothetical protein
VKINQNGKAPPPTLNEEERRELTWKFAESVGNAAKAERAQKAQQEAKFKAAPPALQQQKAQGPPNLGLRIPSKQEKFLKELEEANRIRKPGEEPPKVAQRQVQEEQRTTKDEGSGGVKTEQTEQLAKELADLEDQYNRRKNLEVQKYNGLGQRLLGYDEGFTWCPECQYVSNISLQSELRHRRGLRGCQRTSCKECYQWYKGHQYHQ